MREAVAKPDEPRCGGVGVAARPAATVIVLRPGEPELEVLLVRRTPRARFMAGTWVFPGGAVDPGDGDGQPGLRAAGIRELREEAAITLGPDPELVAFSHWITPEAVTIRYDTWFYLAMMPDGQQARVDGSEIVDAQWITPADALTRAARGEMEIVLPTRKQLERLAGSASPDTLLAHARDAPIDPVTPRVLGSGEQARIVLPGEPGYGD